MDYNKIRQERASFFILSIISLAIMLVSGIYLINEIKNSQFNIASIIASSAIMFFGLYALTTFAKRLKFVFLAEKIGNCVIYDKLRDINQVADKYKIPPRRVAHAFRFLINNNYITGYKIEGLKIVCLDDERERQQKFIEATAKQEADMKRVKKKTSGRCENCGANIVFEGEQVICPYCGNLIKSKNN